MHLKIWRKGSFSGAMGGLCYRPLSIHHPQMPTATIIKQSIPAKIFIPIIKSSFLLNFQGSVYLMCYLFYFCELFRNIHGMVADTLKIRQYFRIQDSVFI